jgi:hypothetical protein
VTRSAKATSPGVRSEPIFHCSFLNQGYSAFRYYTFHHKNLSIPCDSWVGTGRMESATQTTKRYNFTAPNLFCYSVDWGGFDSSHVGSFLSLFDGLRGLPEAIRAADPWLHDAVLWCAARQRISCWCSSQESRKFHLEGCPLLHIFNSVKWYIIIL